MAAVWEWGMKVGAASGACLATTNSGISFAAVSVSSADCSTAGSFSGSGSGSATASFWLPSCVRPIAVSSFAATHAEGVEDDPRAELYSTLSSVTSGAADDVLGKLAGIDRTRLSANDQMLLDAASAITREMTVAPAGTKPPEAETEPGEVRTVGPEPTAPAPHGDALPAGHETPPPVQAVSAPPAQSRNRGPSKAVDATVEQAQAMIAATRAKLAAIDKLLGDMPE